MKRKVAVIGGGASGMMAAITAARKGALVTIYEHTDRLGKKILATGNGKCNLGNLDMQPSCFYSGNPMLVEQCLEQFSTGETIAFFESLGMSVKEKNGYLYPLGEQAAIVLDVLRYAVEAWKIKVEYNSQIKGIYEVVNTGGEKALCVENGKEKVFFHSVILACGSKASPKTGSDGSGYELAKQMGHKIRPVLPSLVQLKCNDKFCKALSGVRCDAKIHIWDKDKFLFEERGELQLTDYGISGIPVFQLSGAVNRYLHDNKSRLNVSIDFMPDLDEVALEELQKRNLSVKRSENCTVEEFFTGVLNKKIMNVLIKQAGVQPGELLSKVSESSLQKIFKSSKQFKMHITESNGFEQAQVCTGGVDMNEVSDNLESKKVKGVYFAGELLDVDGRCGGYNLQWAWSSGYIAGSAAAEG